MKKITILAILLILMGCSNDHKAQVSDAEQISIAPQADKDLSPEQQEIFHFLMGEIALDRDKPEVALKEYEALNKSAPDALTAARATSIAIEQKDFQAAGESAKIWADAMPDDIQTQAIATSIYLKTNNVDQAMQLMPRLVTKDDQKTFENLLLLRSTLEDEQHAKAFIDLMESYGTQKKDIRVLYMGASTAQEMKNTSKATALSSQITALDPNWSRGAVLKVQLQYESGKIDEALASVTQLIQAHPQENMYKYLQAKMLLEKGDFDASLHALNALKQDPKYRNEALLDLARLSVQKKDFKTANEILTQYLVYDPNSDEAKYFLGYVLQQMGQYKTAMERFRSVKPGFYYVNASIQVAILMATQGQVDQSLSELDSLIKSNPKEAGRIDLVKTQILLDANRIEEAYGSLNKILTQNDQDIELRYIRGLIAMELGHTDQAESDLRFVVSADPKQIDAINDLSALLIQQKNFDEAKYYIEQAMGIAPKNPRTLDNMGWLLHQQGQSKDAITYLEKAHAASQDDVIAAHYGQALWEAGKHEAALDIWNNALKTHPNDPLLMKIMKDHVVTPASN